MSYHKFIMNSKHPGYFEDPFEKAFGKKKGAHKIHQSQEEIDLVSDFQKLRINDDFHQVKKQQKETLMTPTLSTILHRSPLPDETLNENGEIDFKSIIQANEVHPIINECIADDIDKLNEINTPLFDESNKVVIGVFEDVEDIIPIEMLQPLPQYMEEEEKEEEVEEEEEDSDNYNLNHIPRFPDDEEDEGEGEGEEEDIPKFLCIKTMADHNFNAVSSSDESSDPDSNSETEGAYPSDDDDSDKNPNNSDYDFEN